MSRTTKSKPQLYFRTYSWTTESGYSKTAVRIVRDAEESSIADLMAKCINNRVGYSDPNTAREMLRRYSQLHEAGFSHEVEWSWSPWIELVWQHYKPENAYKPEDASADAPLEYCEARIAVDDSVRGLKRSMELFQLVEKAILRTQDYKYAPFRSPAPTLTALGKLHAKPFYRAKFDGEWWSTNATLAPGKPVPAMNADGECRIATNNYSLVG